jgi:hypothetical protein
LTFLSAFIHRGGLRVAISRAACVFIAQDARFPIPNVGRFRHHDRLRTEAFGAEENGGSDAPEQVRPTPMGCVGIEKDFSLPPAFFVGIKTVHSHFLLAKMPTGGCKDARVFLCIFNEDSKLTSCYRTAWKTQDTRTPLRISENGTVGAVAGVQPLVGKGNDHER